MNSKVNGSNVTFVRCAIYTRKSNDDGLEQEFNSLDAQRLSAENYIASQTHENWRLVSKHYDDGGFSGGNMDRPALQELFDDIRSGLVDMVVVYKIDRLSRSLFDFSKIIELFEKHNVGFVSVTQAFNTSTSSGKLMLNMLLSFAQYERELTGERIRDKFASSLKKGMWMGGVVMLGYEVKERKLVINENEAKIIRFIYNKFIETESYCRVCQMLNNAGHRTKIKKLKTGEATGGQMFEPKAVQRILKNPYYKGCVSHKGNVYQGEHEAIIDEETWNRVQEIFANHSSNEKVKYASPNPALLSGLIRCAACNCLMGADSAKKGNITYRYYTCYNHKKYGICKAQHKSIPADMLEQNVIDEVLRILKSPEVTMKINKLAEQQEDVEKAELFNAVKNLHESWNYLYHAEKRKILALIVKNVDILNDGIKINLNLEGFDGFLLNLATGT
ncbi:MAG: recombinase family protein [Holosporaceae bacterium]|jgi:DNA invertase Pin-like site-specific DNA recombinase|nr:recombinase family protein [Holosporaceae bacterium]